MISGTRLPARTFLEVLAARDAVAGLPGTELCCCGYHTSATLQSHLWDV